jgi:hypothetical protein
MTNHLGILDALHGYMPTIHIHEEDGRGSCEFGGELPSSLVTQLRGYGAEVLLYRHHGVNSTVVTFWQRGSFAMKINELFTIVLPGLEKIPVPPIDSNPGCSDEGMMVYRSRKAAVLAAEHQNYMYDLDCVAISLSELE